MIREIFMIEESWYLVAQEHILVHNLKVYVICDKKTISFPFDSIKLSLYSCMVQTPSFLKEGDGVDIGQNGNKWGAGSKLEKGQIPGMRG